MRKVVVSAPGKLVLIGEYAALTGAPAVVLAVNRRVSVSVTGRERRHCCISASPMYPPAEFIPTAAGIHWLDGPGDRYGLLAPLVAELASAGGPAVDSWPPLDIRLDSRALFHSAGDGFRKLGLGSSAALTVALGCALALFTTGEDRFEPARWLAHLLSAHSRFQGGAGSGLDVAASLHGGVIVYRRHQERPVTVGRLPTGLRIGFVWTGRDATTADYLADLSHWRDSQPDRYREMMRPLVAQCRNALALATEDNAEGFVKLVGNYGELMGSLGAAAGLDIVSQPHRQLARVAASLDIAYKPCGAGGGDLGVVVTTDPERLQRFNKQVEKMKFEPIALEIDPVGVRAETVRRR